MEDEFLKKYHIKSISIISCDTFQPVLVIIYNDNSEYKEKLKHIYNKEIIENMIYDNYNKHYGRRLKLQKILNKIESL